MSRREREPSGPGRHERVIREFFTAVILHGQITAGAIGMNLTDLFALNIVEMYGPLAAGELAERTGLSTGATTRLIDRLEHAGQVRRVADPADRRRVLLEKIRGHELDEALETAFAPIGRSIERLMGHYPARRLDEVLGFVAQMTTALQAASKEIHQTTATRKRLGPEN